MIHWIQKATLVLWGGVCIFAVTSKALAASENHSKRFIIQAHQLDQARHVALQQIKQRYQLKTRKAKIARTNAAVFEIDGTTESVAMMQRELQTAGIAVEEDQLAQLDAVPNDPMYSQQWGLSRLNLPAVWDVQTGSSAVVIAVVDTGVDLTHPELQGHIWMNPGEDLNHNGVEDPSDVNGIDDDQDGYVDNFHGADCITGDGDPSYGAGEIHSTAVAGTIGAATNNGVGMAGANWNAKIMFLRAFDFNGGYLSAIAECIDFATQKQAPIINSSWSSSTDSPTVNQAIINYGQQANGVMIKSAGNSAADCGNNPSAQALCYPNSTSNISNMITIAALDQQGNHSGFSNYGLKSTDVAAPGTAILTTVPVANGSYSFLDGTSFSAPLVSGIVGLLISQNPTASVGDIRRALISTVSPLSWAQSNSLYPLKSGGEVNAIAALNAINQPNQLPSIDSVTANVQLDATITIPPGERVQLHAVVTDADSPANYIRYQWTLEERPAASTAVLNTPDTSDTSFLPDRVGNYRAKIVVTDLGLATVEKTVEINIDQIAVVPATNNSTANTGNNSEPGINLVQNSSNNGDASVTYVASSCAMTQLPDSTTGEENMKGILLLMFVSLGMLLFQKGYLTSDAQANNDAKNTKNGPTE